MKEEREAIPKTLNQENDLRVGYCPGAARKRPKKDPNSGTLQLPELP